MDPLTTRARRVALLLLLVGLSCAGAVQAQSDLGKIAFSVIQDGNIVHVAQIAFQSVGDTLAVASTIGVTQRPGLLRIEAGEALERTLFLGNETPQPQTFSVTLLLDDRQADLTLEGTTDKNHVITVDPNAQQRLTMRFPALEAGLHNFILLVFYDVSSSAGRAQGLFTPYADSLMVGEGPVPEVSVARPPDDQFLEGRSVPGNQALPPRGLSLSATETPTTEQELLHPPLELKAGEPFSYFIHVRNGLPRQGEADEFVLVALWDGVQVPVDPRGQAAIAHFTLPANGLVSVPAQLVPATPGTHTLNLLAIRNPYALQAGMGTLEVLHLGVTVEVQ